MASGIGARIFRGATSLCSGRCAFGRGVGRATFLVAASFLAAARRAAAAGRRLSCASASAQACNTLFVWREALAAFRAALRALLNSFRAILLRRLAWRAL